MAIRFSNTFLLRKLHQLTGVVPLGVFFFVHMWTNSAALNGAKSFNEHVQDIHDMPYLLFLEIFGIFLPLLFHSVHGIELGRGRRTLSITDLYATGFTFFNA
jgi:succinate dehydrogenase / fumarate reductase cytochrome b subunit